MKENNLERENEEAQIPASESIDTSMISSSPGEASISHDSYGALRFRDFRLLLIGLSIATLGQQMITVAIGWELYDRTSSALVLGGVGLAHRPPFMHAGHTLLLAVTGFGVATILFGLSHWFWLSFLMLFLLGAFDNISVVIRSTLLLVRTPDEMRGRVSAVSSLFIGTSNQLGGFESGLAAQLFGPILAVVAGGIGTILVVLLVACFWPEMRHLSSLRETSQARSQ